MILKFIKYTIYKDVILKNIEMKCQKKNVMSGQWEGPEKGFL